MVGEARRQHGSLLLVGDVADTSTVRVLDRVALAKTGGGNFDEAWVQRLVQRYPQTLPITEIEPGLSAPVPICMELPTPAGFADNLLVTPDGDIVLVECKLWRNPEARREVVAQIIDYAHCMASWSYEDLERAVARASVPAGEARPSSLFAATHEIGTADEAAFIDTVSRNLRLGRMLLLVVGDGIREGVETLAEYLQAHAGFHFTLGVVEMAVYGMPDGGFVVQPRVLARTVNIERGIVRIEGGQLVVEPPRQTREGGRARVTSITEERFYEQLAAIDPSYPVRLRAFIAEAMERGLVIEWGVAQLMLKWEASDGQRFGLVYLQGEQGAVRTDAANWLPDKRGRVDLSHAFLRDLAGVVGGSVKETPRANSWYVLGPEKKPLDIGALLAHRDECLRAIDRFVQSLDAAFAAEYA